MNSLRQRHQFDPKNTVVTALHFWVKRHFNRKAEKTIPEWSSEKTQRPGMLVITERPLLASSRTSWYGTQLCWCQQRFFRWVQKVSPGPELPGWRHTLFKSGKFILPSNTISPTPFSTPGDRQSSALFLLNKDGSIREESTCPKEIPTIELH